MFTSPLNGAEGVQSPLNAIPQNTWTHLSVVVNLNQETSLYVNGIDVTEIAYNGILTAISSPSSNMYFGKDVLNNQQGQNGKVDNISIWNKALNQSEIQEYMNCPPTGNEVGLVGYWNMDEGTGTMLTDLSGNGNDGTINGATWSNNTPTQICDNCTTTDSIYVEILNVDIVQNDTTICQGDSIELSVISNSGAYGPSDFVGV